MGYGFIEPKGNSSFLTVPSLCAQPVVSFSVHYCDVCQPSIGQYYCDVMIDFRGFVINKK